MPEAESSLDGERCGHKERASDGLVQSHQGQGNQADFHAPEHSRQSFLSVNTLQGAFFSFLPISLAVPGNQPPPKKTRLSLSQPFVMPLRREAAAHTATLLAAPAMLGLFLLWAITCWRKECGAGQGSLRALLTAPDSCEQGGAWGGFLSGTPGAGRGGDFFFFNRSFSVIAFRRVRFASCCFTEVGKCRGACHRKGGRGIGLAVSWLLKPPAMGKNQRRCLGNNRSPGYFLLLSSTQIARGCGETRRFKTATRRPG